MHSDIPILEDSDQSDHPTVGLLQQHVSLFYWQLINSFIHQDRFVFAIRIEEVKLISYSCRINKDENSKTQVLGSCLLPVEVLVKLLESDHSSCGFIPQFITRQSETLPDTNFTGYTWSKRIAIHALLQVVIHVLSDCPGWWMWCESPNIAGWAGAEKAEVCNSYFLLDRSIKNNSILLAPFLIGVVSWRCWNIKKTHMATGRKHGKDRYRQIVRRNLSGRVRKTKCRDRSAYPDLARRL